MIKTEMIKTLLKYEIRLQRTLVKNACENQLMCFELYLFKRKTELNTYSESRLEALVECLNIIQKAA